MALTQTSDIAVLLLAKYVEDQIRAALRAALVLPKLVMQKDLRGKKSKVWSSPQWPKLTAAGVNENADLVGTTVTPTADDITVSEVGIQVDITDLSKETSEVTPEEYSRQGVIAVKHKMESDIAALFSGFTNTVGTTNTDLDLDILIAAIEKLETLENEEPMIMVLHPRQVGTYRRKIAGASGSTASYFARTGVDPTVKLIPGFVDEFIGIPVFKSPYVPKINANVDYCGALITPSALGMAILRDVRVEPDRDASARVTEMVVSSAYGVGELDDSCGVGIVSKVAA